MRDNTTVRAPTRVVSTMHRFGTTGLHYSLGLAPGISISRPREPGSSHMNGAWGRTR